MVPWRGWQALLYAGLVSVGIGYTLQVVGQRGAHPAHAAIILSLETVFAAIGGVLLLGEHLDERAVVGCALMLAGMLISESACAGGGIPPQQGAQPALISAVVIDPK